jgi:preprotein translocase subunit SecD
VSDIEEKPRPGLRFLWLTIITLVLAAIIAGGVIWSNATTTPKLALDLEGGTSIILEPQVSKGTDISKEQLDQAVAIIRQRVDSTGVSEAEITTQGDRNIVVNLPGNPDEETRNLVRSSAQLVFRRVALVGDPRSQEQIQKEQEKSGEESGGDDGLSDEERKRLEDLTGADSQGDGQSEDQAPSGGGDVVNAGGETKKTDESSEKTKSSKSESKDAEKSGEGSGSSDSTKVTDSTPRPLFDPEKDASEWQSDKIIKEYTELDCTNKKNRTGGQQQPADEPVVSCSEDGQAKYILGPVELSGDHLADANAGYKSGPNGVQTNEPAVNLKFDNTGREIFKQITSDITGKQQPYNQFAIELDGLVLSAPSSDVVITDGNAQITGAFSLDEAQTLADQLKNGSLPLSFQVQSEDQISPTLGSNYLKIGLLTGMVGLLLVVVYSLLQYRVLGLVTVSSLVVAGVLTYLLLLLGIVEIRLPTVSGRCRRYHHRNRHGGGLVHRLLRTCPRRTAQRSQSALRRRGRLGPCKAHDLRLEGSEHARRGHPLHPGRRLGARLRLHSGPDRDHRRAHRLPVHPPDAAVPGPHEVLRRGPPDVRNGSASARSQTRRLPRSAEPVHRRQGQVARGQAAREGAEAQGRNEHRQRTSETTAARAASESGETTTSEAKADD